MSIVAVIGTQWGDEGKGKVVDRYGQQAHWVVRYQGGNNAGHTIVVGNEKKILHLIPSGAMHPQAGVALGQGVVISPEALIQEIESLSGVYTLESRLKVDLRAHVVTPMQIAADIQREQRGSGVGSTRNGIGPCHEDRAGKRGVRCGDFLFNPEQARRQLEKQIEHWSYAGSGEQVFMELAGFIRKLEKIFANVTDLVLDAYQQGKNILLEGAQGHL
ncbi:MAG TPA: adenylosuccinate synthetase, partial [Candidatus Nanoarchaeia archaeon]|nr:adenylosuccinate synthetase [Candidatus Nanoarchaeia archaeon]